MPRSLSLALLLLLGVAACGTATSPARQSQSSGCLSAGRHVVDGGVISMPSGARAGEVPLILVVIPGGGGDRSDRLGVSKAGNRAGFAVLYPVAEGGRFWTLNHAQGDKDVADVTALLDRMAATGCFDTRRISITGVSNGAGFATRMGCELPTRFAAVVPVAAGYRALDPCPAEARYDYLDVHGAADTVV